MSLFYASRGASVGLRRLSAVNSHRPRSAFAPPLSVLAPFPLASNLSSPSYSNSSFAHLQQLLLPKSSLSPLGPTTIRRGKASASSNLDPEGAFDTGIRVYNSLTGGPTVYDHAHLGHARNYIQIDIILRILKNYFGYSVDHVLGMTNIDDKIIVRANELGIAPEDLANRFEQGFFDDMRTLGVIRPDRIGRVTEHLKEIVDFIKVIQDKGLAYTVNGSVYFDSTKFGARGDKMNPNGPSETVGFDSGDAEKDKLVQEKRNPKDFALWKKSKPGEPGWANPFSDTPGRPGWHIECSAVSTKQLGPRIDVHAGGIDLLFPHHNNEICQCDAHFDYQREGPQWVNYFLHTGHLHIQGKKMSKSLKNFITIKEFLKQNSPMAFRIFCLGVPFNSDVDFNSDRMSEAQSILSRYHQFFSNTDTALRYISATVPAQNYERKWNNADLVLSQTLFAAESILRKCLEDNFDTVGAMRIISDVVREGNLYMTPALSRTSQIFRNPTWPKDSLEHVDNPYGQVMLPLPSLIQRASKFVSESMALFGVDFVNASSANQANAEAKGAEADYGLAVSSLANLRQIMRSELKKGDRMDKKKLFQELDLVRDKTIRAMGYQLKDAADGSFVLTKLNE